MERPAMQRIYERGRANGVACEIIDKHRLHELEPHAAGVGAIHVPEAGIIDFVQVCETLRKLICDAGHDFLYNARVT